MEYRQVDGSDPKFSMEDEQSDPMLPHQTLKQRASNRSWLSPKHLLISSMVQTTIILICLAVIFTQLHAERTVCPNDFIQAKFGRDAKYMSVAHHYDGLWEDLAGESAVFNLSDPKKHNEELPASIAMFHQLHCLSAFRNAIQQAREGVDPGVDWRANAHWPHCFDYLRKTIICWADGTIERQPHFRNGTIAPFIDGSHDVRQCGNSEKLIQIMTDAGKTVKTRPFPAV